MQKDRMSSREQQASVRSKKDKRKEGSSLISGWVGD